MSERSIHFTLIDLSNARLQIGLGVGFVGVIFSALDLIGSLDLVYWAGLFAQTLEYYHRFFYAPLIAPVFNLFPVEISEPVANGIVLFIMLATTANIALVMLDEARDVLQRGSAALKSASEAARALAAVFPAILRRPIELIASAILSTIVFALLYLVEIIANTITVIISVFLCFSTQRHSRRAVAFLIVCLLCALVVFGAAMTNRTLYGTPMIASVSCPTDSRSVTQSVRTLLRQGWGQGDLEAYMRQWSDGALQQRFTASASPLVWSTQDLRRVRGAEGGSPGALATFEAQVGSLSLQVLDDQRLADVMERYPEPINMSISDQAPVIQAKFRLELERKPEFRAQEGVEADQWWERILSALERSAISEELYIMSCDPSSGDWQIARNLYPRPDAGR